MPLLIDSISLKTASKYDDYLYHIQSLTFISLPTIWPSSQPRRVQPPSVSIALKLPTMLHWIPKSAISARSVSVMTVAYLSSFLAGYRLL